LLAANPKQQFFATNEVTVLQRAKAEFEASPDSGPSPLAVHFLNHSVGDKLEWNWDFGNGQTSKEQNPPNQTYSTPNTYNVRLTVQGPDLSNGSSNSSTTAVQIRVLAPSKADFTASPTTGDSPLAVQFHDQSAGNPTAWIWDFGDGTTGSDRNPRHVYNKPGPFNVSLRVTGPGGTANVTRNRLIVVNEPLHPVPNVTGKTLADARTSITKGGFVVGKVVEIQAPIPIDKVIAQDPFPGQPAPAGRAVNLTHWR
jgi:PKD repeat protein